MDIDEIDRRLALLGVEGDEDDPSQDPDDGAPSVPGTVPAGADQAVPARVGDPVGGTGPCVPDVPRGRPAGVLDGDGLDGGGVQGLLDRLRGGQGAPGEPGRSPAVRRVLGPDPRELLPPLRVPDGYLLDGRALLRYSSGGDPVPGARLVTLSRAWRFTRAGGAVWVPEFLVRSVEELSWVADRDVGAELGAAVHGDRSVAALGVPELYWEEAAEVPYGVWAPELDPSRMWGVGQVADALGVAGHTVSTYLARGQMPAPQARVAGAPLWAVPVVWRWQASRPGQGVRPARARRGSRVATGGAGTRPGVVATSR